MAIAGLRRGFELMVAWLLVAVDETRLLIASTKSMC